MYHLSKQKDRAREEKITDIEQALGGVQRVITMNLQEVKVCSSLMASSLNFKSKCCAHSFTMCNLATKHCTCY